MVGEQVSIYEHYRKEEYAFVDQVLDWKEMVANEYRFKVTDFLDPRQQHILSTLIGKSDEVRVSFWGGHSAPERMRAILYPDYYTPEESDYSVSTYEITYPSKFVTIEHPHILGSLMSIGIKREKFGDIISTEERYQVVLADEVADYVLVNLESIGKAKVRLEKVNRESLIEGVKETDEQFVTVSSMRVDSVVSEAFRLPRAKVKVAITGEKIKVNWKIVDNPSYTIHKGDVLSVRGFGRCEILELEGETKKGKHRIILGFPK